MNNRIRFNLLLLNIVMFAPALAQAQPAPQSPPSPPYLNPIPDNSQWLITVTTSPGSTQPPPAAPGRLPARPTIKSQTITITGDIRRDAFTWSNGVQTETWFYHGAMLKEDVGTMEVYLDNQNLNLAADVPANRSWDYFDWLTPQNYIGPSTDHGISCYEFRTGEGEATIHALIDIQSHFPVLLEKDGAAYRYQKLSAKPPKLTLPPKFAAKWNQFLTTMKTLSSSRPAR